MGKIRLLGLLFLLLFLLSGCWDNREINELGIVTAVGVDKGQGENRYSVTAQIANPASGGSSEKGGAAKSSVWIGTAEGDSLFDAVRELGNISSKRIMWAHNSVVVIGEGLARDGIIPVVDFFTHSPELRMKVLVVVSEGDAKEYIAARTGMESPSGNSFALLEGYRALSAESVESHMLNVSVELKNELGNPIIAKISFKQSTLQSQDGENKTADTINLSGAAVFKRDKMLGWLSAEESLGEAWILNQTKNTVVTVPVSAYEDKTVSVETQGVKANIKSKIVNGMPQIAISVTGSGEIVEEDGTTNLDMDEVKKRVATLINEKVKDDIEKSLFAAQHKYGVDIFGFSATVHAQNAKEWKSGLKDRWQMVFPNIQVSVTVELKIHGSTLNQEPMNVPK